MMMMNRILRRQNIRTKRINVQYEKRGLCSNKDNFPEYLEDQQRRDIQSPEFYESNAAKHRYFYYIDLQGRLFLEDIFPKNIATSLKSSKFLSFFYRNLRPNVASSAAFADYPYSSPCGKEENYIKVADTPFVFTDVSCTQQNGNLDTTESLDFGGELKQEFNGKQLMWSKSTGRLYHPITLPSISKRFKSPVFALIKSHLAIQLSEHITFLDDGSMIYTHHGRDYPITMIA